MDDNNNAKIFDEADIQEGKVMAGLSHLGILFFLPLVVCPKSRFARFHANQSLVLLIFSVAITILSTTLARIPVLPLLFTLLSLAVWIMQIVGLIGGLTGKAIRFPLVDDIKIFSYDE